VTYPKRLVIVFSPNGTVKSAWEPQGSELAFTLGPILGPLSPHQKDLIVLSGVDMESSYHGKGDGMHLNGIGHLLTGTEMVDVGFGDYWAGGISVDQHIAQHLGAATPWSSLELAVELPPATVRGRLSYLGAARPVPPEVSPLKVFARLFDAASPQRIAMRQSVLDTVDRDLAELRGAVGAGDRQKLDAHLTAVRSIETRLALPQASCPATPPDPRATHSFVDVGRLQMDLLVRALACDLTRVATLMWAPSTSNLVFSWLAIEEQHHSLSHTLPKDAPAQVKLIEINRWYVEQLRYLIEAMKAVPEGDGTLFDHSVVLFCNELSDGEIHTRRDMPFLLAGSASGAFKTGRYLKLGGAAAGATHNNLLVSLCQAMDVDTSSFGNPAYCAGPLSGLTS